MESTQIRVVPELVFSEVVRVNACSIQTAADEAQVALEYLITAGEFPRGEEFGLFHVKLFKFTVPLVEEHILSAFQRREVVPASAYALLALRRWWPEPIKRYERIAALGTVYQYGSTDYIPTLYQPKDGGEPLLSLIARQGEWQAPSFFLTVQAR